MIEIVLKIPTNFLATNRCENVYRTLGKLQVLAHVGKSFLTVTFRRRDGVFSALYLRTWIEQPSH